MNEIHDRWKGRGRMVDLSVNGRPEICHEETVCEAVNWISPERDTVVAGFFRRVRKNCRKATTASSCLSLRLH
jgi:hypothetical protein